MNVRHGGPDKSRQAERQRLYGLVGPQKSPDPHAALAGLLDWLEVSFPHPQTLPHLALNLQRRR